ncbi:Rieske 2Fe-2S domain-containing protein [Saccharopolyspora dendranthemae]|uniref:Nitrite reductase/ring-hydroxylating ferredoxin subunit n=1 Tax=Saccharopolyspora dendranthemae TaxID=1181886 RepID=A0A561U7S2_9PSEU|nr:Rieske 2Fe-2S domain-containing protein [Saccharopolyspora dendranthemae]TWF95411.1 nitrite reductase/ring-hydroxylating ferredoxin subunit [Saccharopolyspora dendranthemae]
MPQQEMLGRRLARRLTWLDPVEDKLQPLVRGALRKAMPLRNFLDGTWLGAPLHPALTDIPVGAMTTALILDVAGSVSGSQRCGVAADGALSVAVLATLPAALTGTSDWRDLKGEPRRVASAHALLNASGLVLNIASLVGRVRGRRRYAKASAGAAFALTSIAAHIGGELSYGMGVRVNQDSAHAGPVEFTEVLADADLAPDEFKLLEVAGERVLLARSRTGDPLAIAAVCSHAGGPLEEGERDGDRVICPWHGSCFEMETGEVVHGPAVFAQPRYETRVRAGRIAIRRAES